MSTSSAPRLKITSAPSVALARPPSVTAPTSIAPAPLEWSRLHDGEQTAAQVESLLTSLRQRTASLFGLPTQDDIVALEKKLNSLTRKVRKIEKATSAA